jgi:hypothetical protein
VVVLAACVVLAGCSKGASPDEAYLEVVRPLLHGTDEQWLQLRSGVCEVLAAKPDTEQWLRELKVLLDMGLSVRDAGAVIGASTASACPQFTGLGPRP